MSGNALSVVIAAEQTPSRNAIRELLQRASVGVLEARTAEEVVRLAAQHPLLVIIDTALTQFDGQEVYRRLSSEPATAGLPVLFVAAVPDDSETSSSASVGTDRRHAVRPAPLLAAVKSLMRLWAAADLSGDQDWRLQTLLDSLPDGVCLLDRHGIVRRCNRALAALAGKPGEELIGQAFAAIAGGFLQMEGPGPWERVSETSRSESVDCFNGQTWFSITASAVVNERGVLVGKAVLLVEIAGVPDRPDHSAGNQLLEREAATLEQISQLSPTVPVTAQMFGMKSLKEHSPGLFAELVERYAALMEQALEETNYVVDNHVAEELRNLGEQMGSLGSGPRDVIEVHNTALRKKRESMRAGRAQHYVEEGRFLVLELMGHLVSYYRRYAMGIRARASRSAAPRPRKDNADA